MATFLQGFVILSENFGKYSQVTKDCWLEEIKDGKRERADFKKCYKKKILFASDKRKEECVLSVGVEGSMA